MTALKDSFGPGIARGIAAMIGAASPRFPAQAFLKTALAGYEPLGLMARGRHIAAALHRHLPQKYPLAIRVLMDSLQAPRPRFEGVGSMAGFFYLPHVMFVADYGVEHFEPSMRAQYELTQRFTAEFSLRSFLIRHPEATLARLERWAMDPSEHVRRLVSEGTRPRLPWAPRLRAFQADPRPVLRLLERLKDDPSLYVRRSVANNLNDIGKDHPELAVQTARSWLKGATPQRRWIVRHALRSAVKRAEPGALQVLGYGHASPVLVRRARIAPARARVGDTVFIRFELSNPSRTTQRVLADLRVFFAKRGGRSGAKVFKLKTLALAPGESFSIHRKLSLADLTTRKHHPGRHRVEVLLNGKAQALGSFVII